MRARCIARRTASIGWLLAIGLAISACSSGDDPAGGGSGGGIGGSGLIAGASGISQGPIAGFGSIVLNGEVFDTDRARIRVESRDAVQSELRVGMEVRAEVDFDTSTASVVDYYPSISAPVESMDAASGLLGLLGQTVRLDGGTTYDGIDPTTISPGDMLEISGLRDAAGALVATFVRTARMPDRLAITGAVGLYDATTARLDIAGVDIDTGSSSLQDSLAPGSLVFVSGRPGPGAGSTARILADTVTVLPGLAGSIASRVEIEGIVTGFDSTQRIEVDGLPVRLSGSTRVEFSDGRAAPASRIALNTRIEVEGELLANDGVSATRIVVLPTEDSDLTGLIESLQPASGVLVMLGVEIHTTPSTRYESDAAANFMALRIGDYAEVRAAYEGDRLVASRVEVDEPEDEARLEGPLTDLDSAQQRFSVLGVSIVPDGDTEFEIDDDEVTASDFLSAARPGDIVEVRWSAFTSTAAAPDEVSLE